MAQTWPEDFSSYGRSQPHQGQSRTPEIIAQDCSLREQKRPPAQSRTKMEGCRHAASFQSPQPGKHPSAMARSNRSQGKGSALNSSIYNTEGKSDHSRAGWPGCTGFDRSLGSFIQAHRAPKIPARHMKKVGSPGMDIGDTLSWLI